MVMVATAAPQPSTDRSIVFAYAQSIW